MYIRQISKPLGTVFAKRADLFLLSFLENVISSSQMFKCMQVQQNLLSVI